MNFIERQGTQSQSLKSSLNLLFFKVTLDRTFTSQIFTRSMLLICASSFHTIIHKLKYLKADFHEQTEMYVGLGWHSICSVTCALFETLFASKCRKICFWTSFHTLFALLREKYVLISLWQNKNYCGVTVNCGQSLKKEYTWPDCLLNTPKFYRFRFPRWKLPGRRPPQLGGRDSVVHVKGITGKVISCIVPYFLILSPMSLGISQ